MIIDLQQPTASSTGTPPHCSLGIRMTRSWISDWRTLFFPISPNCYRHCMSYWRGASYVCVGFQLALGLITINRPLHTEFVMPFARLHPNLSTSTRHRVGMATRTARSAPGYAYHLRCSTIGTFGEHHLVRNNESTIAWLVRLHTHTRPTAVFCSTVHTYVWCGRLRSTYTTFPFFRHVQRPTTRTARGNGIFSCWLLIISSLPRPKYGATFASDFALAYPEMRLLFGDGLGPPYLLVKTLPPMVS
jgi:hypothetical protein